MRVFQAEGRALAKFLWPWEWVSLEHSEAQKWVLRFETGCRSPFESWWSADMGGSRAVGGWLCLTLIKPWLHSCQASCNSYPKCRQESGFSDWRGGNQAVGSDPVTVTASCFVFWFSVKALSQLESCYSEGPLTLFSGLSSSCWGARRGEGARGAAGGWAPAVALAHGSGWTFLVAWVVGCWDAGVLGWVEDILLHRGCASASFEVVCFRYLDLGLCPPTQTFLIGLI